ncbi:MAG: hypothetical protein ACTHK2_07935 [Dokdonella sp.]|uniref:hypothetical protein n=1 Tax=Dokdonella sp. TaxID=2291710 RepID=UPI003F7E76E9
MRISLYAGITVALLAARAEAGSFTGLDIPDGQMTSLSHNGRIAAGIAGESGWRWAKDRGASVLDGFVEVEGMSSWAQPIAGAWTNADALDVAALAYSNSGLVGGPVEIGGMPGTSGLDGTLSVGYGVSDTKVAVGLAYDDGGNAIAFRWDAGSGITRLAVNRPGNYSRANGVSADGSVAWGWNDQDDGFRSAVLWHDGAPTDLVDADGNPVGEADGGSRDGSVIVGSGYATPDGASAWRWTAATGVQPLGVPTLAPGRHALGAPVSPERAALVSARPERASARLGDAAPQGFPPASYAFGVSDDGNVIVGRSGAFPMFFATVWTPATGMVRLDDYAAARGVAIPAGWSLMTASAVSADGLVIGGWGVDPGGALDSFLIDLHDDAPREALLEAHGTVDWNDLPDGPFAGVPVGTPVTMTFRLSPGGFEIEPGAATSYAIGLDTFSLVAGTASDTLVATPSGPGVWLTNDYPLSDGIHLFETPTSTSGQAMEFELFNPGGDLFDSDDLGRINRTFGPEFFEKVSWMVAAGGEFGMTMVLDSVSIHDVDDGSDVIFDDGFESPQP